jgi:hypothetical protein
MILRIIRKLQGIAGISLLKHMHIFFTVYFK